MDELLEDLSTVINRDCGLVCSDAQDFLKGLRSECADVVFLDPPFNLGKRYGERSEDADLLEEEAYEDFLREVLQEAVRVVAPGGALFLYHLPWWAMRLGNQLEESLEFRHWIAVMMKNGFPKKGHLYPAHYSLLYFTKGEPARFVRPKIPAAKCRKCGDYVKDYGGYRKYVEQGINLSDIWEDLSPVRHKSTKNRPANELPETFVERVLQISGREGGLVVDPFVGAGTMAVAAIRFGMRVLAADREISCCVLTRNRLLDLGQEQDRRAPALEVEND